MDGGTVVCDLEAGVGTLLRVQPEQLDVVLVVAEPSAKGIDVARRAAEIARSRARVIVLANKVRSEADVEEIRRALPIYELVAIPEDPVVQRAEREGRAPLDVDPEAPAVEALARLAARVASSETNSP